MFTTVRYFIKTSLIFLFTGLCAGLYMSIKRSVFGEGYSALLVTAHTHSAA